jgi:O-antigen/teichoic acid export membrane protein
LAAAASCVLLREFARRFTLADLHVSITLLMDVVVVAIQFGVLAGLAGAGWLSAATAYLAIGVASGVVGLGWLASARGHFGSWKHRLRADIHRGWRLGRWMLVGQVAALAQAFGLHWLLAGLLGTKAAGIYTACNSIVLFSNPLVLGIGNVLGPRAARAFADDGAQELRRLVWRGTLVLAVSVAVFSLTVSLIGGDLVQSMYGQEYTGYGHLVAVLALGLFVNSLGMAADQGLKATESTAWILVAGVVGTAVMLAVATAAAAEWGLMGAAWAYVAGHVASTCVRCAAFGWLACAMKQGVNHE